MRRTEALLIFAAIWFVVTLTATRTLNSLPLLVFYILILNKTWGLTK